ncbi:MAG: hypothetical protein RL442_2186 [Pseudomonadota bacterium]
MQDCRRESAVFALHAAPDESHRQVRVFMSPTRVAFIKAIDGHKVLTPNRQVAGARTLPAVGRTQPPSPICSDPSSVWPVR